MDLDRDLANLKIKHFVGNPAVWRTIKQLDLPSYRCLLVRGGSKVHKNVIAGNGKQCHASIASFCFATLTVKY
jgi:hypothetical protein